MGKTFVSTETRISTIEGTLLEDVEIELNNGESDLNNYIIKTLAELNPEKLLAADWLSHSSQMTE